MKIVVAPDSFKGSLTAAKACRTISRGIRNAAVNAEIVEIPMADGGEGTVEALVQSTGGQLRQKKVTGPLGQMTQADYGILPGREGQACTAVIEMAEAAGLVLVPMQKRNPLNTTTYGLGELILDAVENRCMDFVIGIGGSATNDCGCGMAQALGVKFRTSDGREITRPMTGGLMDTVNAIDVGSLDKRLSRCRFTVACDVRNPLLGPDGASHTYGPQKGADPEKVDILEENMRHIIDLIEAAAGRSVRNIPGAGAAGGLGAGLMAFLEAMPESGIEIVMRYCRFAERIRDADLLITGEGRIDSTSACGKTISGIAAAARMESVPVVAVAGILGQGAEKLLEIGVEKIIVIERGALSEEQGMLQAEKLLAQTIEKAFRAGDIPVCGD